MQDPEVQKLMDDVDALHGDVDRLRQDVQWILRAISRYGKAYPLTRPLGILERLEELEQQVRSKLK